MVAAISADVRPAPTRFDAPTRRSARRGFSVGIARNAEDVKAAWMLVYHAYRRKGLINSNRLQVHLVPQSLQERSAIVVGAEGDELVTTLSIYEDARLGLPLDAVYPEELDDLRRAGRRLYEVGMFADRCETRGHKPAELFEIMRLPFHYGHWADRTDLVIGVHPHHEPFYRRLIGFEVIGPERTYGMVRDHPVMLLRLNLLRVPMLDAVPRGMQYFLQRPVRREVYDRRFRFHPDTVQRSLRECVASIIEKPKQLDAA